MQHGDDVDPIAQNDAAPMADVLINSHGNVVPEQPRSGQEIPSHRPPPPPAAPMSSAEHKQPVASRAAEALVAGLLLPPPALSSQSDRSTTTEVRISDDDGVVEMEKTLHRASEAVGKVDRDDVGMSAEETGWREEGEEENDDEEESIENLLGSLMGALNTQQGRADFCRLTSGGSAGSLPS